MIDAADDFVLAYCGLVCSECGAYRKGRCKGCHSDKPMNSGCKVKPCAQEKQCVTCAECGEFANLKDCRKLNNFVSKMFGLIFRSDRIGNLNRIREVGFDRFRNDRK